MSIRTRIEEILKTNKVDMRTCEKCHITTVFDNLPILVDRETKEWERIHKHEEKKESLLDKIWRWAK